jgi:hypothetical protein
MCKACPGTGQDFQDRRREEFQYLFKTARERAANLGAAAPPLLRRRRRGRLISTRTRPPAIARARSSQSRTRRSRPGPLPATATRSKRRHGGPCPHKHASGGSRGPTGPLENPRQYRPPGGPPSGWTGRPRRQAGHTASPGHEPKAARPRRTGQGRSLRVLCVRIMFWTAGLVRRLRRSGPGLVRLRQTLRQHATTAAISPAPAPRVLHGGPHHHPLRRTQP